VLDVISLEKGLIAISSSRKRIKEEKQEGKGPQKLRCPWSERGKLIRTNSWHFGSAEKKEDFNC